MINTSKLYEKLNVDDLATLLDLIAVSDINKEEDRNEVLKISNSLINQYIEDESDKIKLLLSYFILLLFNVDYDDYPFIRIIYEDCRGRVSGLMTATTNVLRVVDYFERTETLDKSTLRPELFLLIQAIQDHKALNVKPQDN